MTYKHTARINSLKKSYAPLKMRYHVVVIAIFLNLNFVCKSQNLDSALVDYFENELSFKLTPGNRLTEVKTKHRNRVTLFVSDFQIPFSHY